MVSKKNCWLSDITIVSNLAMPFLRIVVAKMCSTRPSKVLVIRPRNITTDRSDGDSSSGDLPFEIIEEINGHNELYSYREVGLNIEL